MSPPNRPKILSKNQLGKANRDRIQSHIRFELWHLCDQQTIPIEALDVSHSSARYSYTDLSLFLEYKSPSSYSKLINGHSGLTRDKAMLLDSAGGRTTIQTSFLELVEARDRAKWTSAPRPAAGSETGDVFLATPMASRPSELPFEDARKKFLEIAQLIERETDQTVFFAGRDITSSKRFDPPKESFEKNLNAIRGASLFLLIFMSPLDKQSSVWVELGLALENRVPILCIVPSPEYLPYFVRGLNETYPKALKLPKVKFEYLSDLDAAYGFLEAHGRSQFAQLMA